MPLAKPLRQGVSVTGGPRGTAYRARLYAEFTTLLTAAAYGLGDYQGPSDATSASISPGHYLCIRRRRRVHRVLPLGQPRREMAREPINGQAFGISSC